MRTRVYIDGFNLYYGCLKNTQHKWLNPAALCDLLLPRNNIDAVRYFTATVSSRPSDPDQATRQQTYFRALATEQRLSIHLGHFLSHAVTMPVRQVRRRFGKNKGLLNPQQVTSRALKPEATFIKTIRQGALAVSQFPTTMSDAKGTFTKPSSW